ncbi:suppressor APC domain-containing protein 2 [Rhineura floridana]|uniref:suppressor APC domain-containing protein 2 n=1 Tax=Rhineura floridana TaxID=261503 RepID=UPI002AC88D3F|nr:suppressor APC domain-containing protein 2 [Rhineura floridana]
MSGCWRRRRHGRGCPRPALWNVRRATFVSCRDFVEISAAGAAMAPVRDGGPAATEGLPPAFLQSLRTLFDILDDRRRGYVHLREIESRWLQQGGEAKELPRGVLQGLRRAAPASGYLTFERFVLGLRASLFSPEKGGSSPAGKQAPPRPAAPPKSSRAEAEAPAGSEKTCGRGAGGPASWSLEKMPSGQAEQSQRKRAAVDGSGVRKLAGQSQYESTSKVAVDVRRQPRGRGEQRRHTITNGVDYGVLKQMKELEREKDFLLQGLEMVERARAWYHQQIHVLQEHQKRLGKGKAQSDSFAEETPSHLSHLLPRLQELNRCLCELLCLSAKPLHQPSVVMGNGPAPTLTASPPLAGPQQATNMLKDQNRLLTKEVTDKSERITQLEQEKSALIKQLFEARAQSNHDSNQLDSTFI